MAHPQNLQWLRRPARAGNQTGKTVTVLLTQKYAALFAAVTAGVRPPIANVLISKL
jgi:hypothetical protein